MCGIAGITTLDPIAHDTRVRSMLDVQRHRGPDGEGIWSEHGTTLGHRRLAIIDTSNAGAQPMVDRTGRWVVTFNGEIYNYIELRAELEREGVQFATASDTEVLLAAWATWGEAALQRFNGMFAFAIYDRHERQLTLVRDRLGVKPLCWTRRDGVFAFASEVKALVAAGLVGGDWNPDAIYEYLRRGYASEGRSFFAGVTHLAPGHLMRVRPGEHPVTERWWQVPGVADEPFASREELVATIGELIDDAVRLRLRSDVPVGCHLSGGLDSSAILAAAARHADGELLAFTGAFPADPNSDERAFARSVITHANLQRERDGREHLVRGCEIEIDVASLATEFRRLVWHMDEPIAGPGVFPQLAVCDLARRHDVTVVLGGQGGDELFGGYLRHRALHWMRTLRKGSLAKRPAAALELARLGASEWRRVRRTATRTSDEMLSPALLAAVDPELRAELTHGAMSHANVSDLMRHDLASYLPGLLHVEDRTSMAASLESRTPLLDYRLVELAVRIPPEQLFRPGDPKPLLRDAVAPWLPRDVSQRTDKRGFPTPLHTWQERPALTHLVHDLSQQRGDRAVFSDEYLAQPAALAASELWGVLTVQAWLSQLDSGSLAAPFDAAA